MQPKQLRQVTPDRHLPALAALALTDGYHALDQADILDTQQHQLGSSGCFMRTYEPAGYQPFAWRLQRQARLFTLQRMRDLVRRFLFLLCAVAFFTGATVGLAVHGVAANEPCVEHQANDGHPGHHHDGSKGNCLTCCMGVCVTVPDLPPRFVSAIVPVTAAKVAYWDRDSDIDGRTIPPDLIPPIRSV